MELVEQLKNLRRGLPGCRSVVYGDLGAGTVLRAIADESFRQEDHDALLGKAAICLGPAAQNALAAGLGMSGAAPALSRAVLREDGRTCLFLRLPDAPSDAICVVMQGHPELQDIHDTLRRSLVDDG